MRCALARAWCVRTDGVDVTVMRAAFECAMTYMASTRLEKHDLTCVKWGGSVEKRGKDGLHKISGFENWKCESADKHLSEIFEKEEIVYLTAESNTGSNSNKKIQHR